MEVFRDQPDQDAQSLASREREQNTPSIAMSDHGMLLSMYDATMMCEGLDRS